MPPGVALLRRDVSNGRGSECGTSRAWRAAPGGTVASIVTARDSRDL